MKRLFRSLVMTVVAACVAMAVVERTHHHVGDAPCLQCLCSGRDRRWPDTEHKVLCSLDCKTAKQLEPSVLRNSMEQPVAVAILPTQFEVLVLALVAVSNQIHAPPPAPISSVILTTGPPRAPPVL